MINVPEKTDLFFHRDIITRIIRILLFPMLLPVLYASANATKLNSRLLYTIRSSARRLRCNIVSVDQKRNSAMKSRSLTPSRLLPVMAEKPRSSASAWRSMAKGFVGKPRFVTSVAYALLSMKNCSCRSKTCTMVALATPDLLQSGTPLGDMLLEDLADCPRIVALLDTWQVPVAERRELYLAAARGMAAPRKQRFLLLFVDSYKAGSPDDFSMRIWDKVGALDAADACLQQLLANAKNNNESAEGVKIMNFKYT